MGLCTSCFRSRRSSAERELLLPKIATPQPTESLPPPESLLDKAVDVLAALQTGKLPSQDQVNIVLQSIANSSIIRDGTQMTSGYGPLSENGRRIVADLKGVAEATLCIGTEKNVDDRLQDLWFQTTKIEGPPMRINAEGVVDATQEGLSKLQAQAPPSDELATDAANLASSLKSLVQLLMTSAFFRLILSDILVSVRELLAHVAADVGSVALQVQVAAEDVERAAHVDDGSLNVLKGKVKEAVGDLSDVNLPSESHYPENSKDIAIGRIQELVVRAHQDPKTLSALSTILLIVRKYAARLGYSADIIAGGSRTTSIPPITVTPTAETSRALIDFKILLERLASGQSLDPLLQSLASTVADTLNPENAGSGTENDTTELKRYLSDVGNWLDRALSPSDPQYATSRRGTRTLENLYDGGQIIFLSDKSNPNPNTRWTKDLQQLLGHCDAFVAAVEMDKATMRFIRAVDRLYIDVVGLAKDAVTSGIRSQRKWKEEIVKDIVGWLVPRLMRVVGTVPMPRVEFQNDAVDVAVDALLLTAAGGSGEWTPDHFIVRSWNEVRVDMLDDRMPGFTHGTLVPVPGPTVQTSNRLHLHIDGVRVSANRIGYYFKYKGRFVGYSDQGLLSIDAGSTGCPTQGLSVDVELELETTSELAAVVPGALDNGLSAPKLFRVVDVKVAVPGLAFSIDQSKHWILNKIVVQPLAGPVVSRMVAGALETQIRTALEAAEKGLSDVYWEARERKKLEMVSRAGEGGEPIAAVVSLSDYWTVLWAKGSSLLPESDVRVDTQTTTTATLKGIVHTSVTMPEQGPAPCVPQETTIAIGVGAQLFPDKAGPYGTSGEEVLGPGEVARAAIDEVQEAAGEALKASEEAVDGAIKARAEIESADLRRAEREKEESHRDGWRSQVFDFGRGVS